MTLEELTELFRRLGAPGPEDWARSQLNEGIDQVSRYVFVRTAWSCVVSPSDTAWIQQTIASDKARPEDPCAGAGPALERMLAAGVDPRDIHEVVRVQQYNTLFDLCYRLSAGPTGDEPELEDLDWGLMRLEGDEAVGHIGGVHEDLLSLDPSGREMRPERR